MKSNSIGVAAIYCNFKERDLQSPENLLAGCCAQLFEHQLPQDLLTLHSTHSIQQTRPTVKDITRLFDDCVTNHDTVFVVFDALDECLESVRSFFLTRFKTLASNIRLLITTRHIGEIIQELHAFPQIEIRAKTSDLIKYISSKIDDTSRLADFVSSCSSLRQDICNSIVSTADGM